MKLKSNKMSKMPKCEWIILLFIFEIITAQAGLSISSEKKPKPKNLAIIGGGASGLTSAKNALEQGHNVVVYEQTGQLGGIWWYTDNIGKDEYGVPIHTPMYQELR